MSGEKRAPVGELQLVLSRDPARALGLAVAHLMGKPAYRHLKFGPWARVLTGQINRGHYRFVMNDRRQVVGMVGWMFADRDHAERWITGQAERERDASPRATVGDCILFNVWSADDARANVLVLDAARQAMAGSKTLYFRRLYADGRLRPVRLAVNRFIGRHLERHRASL